MKTPMQELFSQLEIEHPELFNVNTAEGKKFIHSYHKFIKAEKEQIMNAFDTACDDENRIGKEYYNDTFNKKETWYNESETTERMNIIGQNGNEGTHYEK